MSVQYPMLIGPSSFGGNNNITTIYPPHALDGATDVSSVIFCLNKSGEISEVGFKVFLSGSASSCIFDLVTLDATGVPSNTNYGGSQGTKLSLSQIAEGWNWVTLSQPATGVCGDIVAIRVRPTGSSTADYLSVDINGIYESSLPRRRSNASSVGHQPIGAIRFSDGTVQGMPLAGTEQITFDADTDPDEYGMKFAVPVGMSCNGAFIHVAVASSRDLRILLYDGDDVVRVATITDEDRAYITAGNALGIRMYWLPYELSPDGTYRITLQSPTLNDDITIYEATLITGTYGYVFNGGTDWEETYRANSGSFTDVPAKRIMLSAMIDTITPSTGTSSPPVISSSGAGTYAWAY